MMLIDGDDGVQLLAQSREALRLTHVLTELEMEQVNVVLADHSVSEFEDVATVGMVIDRIRWLLPRPRAHVIRTLMVALGFDAPRN